MPNINLSPVVLPETQITELKRCGRSDDDIKIIAKVKAAAEAKTSSHVAQIILDEVCAKYNVKPLTFQKWHNTTIIAIVNGFKYALIGSWNNGKYILNGLVKSKRRNGQIRWLCNGQADKGTEQVLHIAEQDAVEFPDIKQAQDDFDKMIVAGFVSNYQPPTQHNVDG